ncbi:MAG: hypothetical protein M3Y36_11995, partial [Actinomycetota bacterium]|nr:hypothetical protein [Actinomycetota bacterium]
RGLVTAGGRVLGVTATAASLDAARDRAYQAVSSISWPAMTYRGDIAAAHSRLAPPPVVVTEEVRP